MLCRCVLAATLVGLPSSCPGQGQPLEGVPRGYERIVVPGIGPRICNMRGMRRTAEFRQARALSHANDPRADAALRALTDRFCIRDHD